MIRALLEWIRINKEGKLSALFFLYRWFRLNVIPFAYELGIFLRPHRIAGYYALGSLLAHKYTWMVTHDVRKVTSVGRRAIECFEKTIALDPECLEAYKSCASLLSTMGKIDESGLLLQRAVSVRQHLAERKQLDRLGVRFIAPDEATVSIGAMTTLDTYVKARILGLKTPATAVLLVKPGQSVPNPHFLHYWRKYINVISDPITVERLLPLVRYLEDPLSWIEICEEKLLVHPSAAAMINKQWEEEGRSPLLTLSREDYERGWGRLKLMGVPKEAWFVCLHVRDSGFKDGSGMQDAYRNADIDTYLLAMKSIAARGGWVIRMGNPTMKRLPKMERVIDYAHSDCRSDWMDIFLLAQCRFLIPTSSGLGGVAAAFGVPNVWTNYLPTFTVLFSSQHMFIPKLCWSMKEQRYLTFEELMSPPVSTSVMQHQYDHMGVAVVENSPEEINDLITEMLDRLERTLVYSESEERIQQRFRALTAANGTLYGLDNVPINCRIGRDFLQKYASLLPVVPREVPHLTSTCSKSQPSSAVGAQLDGKPIGELGDAGCPEEVKGVND